jgi:cytidyltransferase-like protein
LGVFDLFHIGHLRYLQFASRRCADLVVGIATDHTATSIKGRLPVIPEDQRLELISGLGFVAEARLAPCSTEYTQAAAAWMADWRINHVVAGGGWQGSDRWARLVPALAEHGISVEFAPQTEFVSTTGIITTVLKRHGAEQCRE